MTTPGGEIPSFGGPNGSNGSSSNFPKKLPSGITFSFSAGGWLQMYMFGVCHALQQSGVVDHHNQKIYFGSSNASDVPSNTSSAGSNSIPPSPQLASTFPAKDSVTSTPTTSSLLAPESETGAATTSTPNNSAKKSGQSADQQGPRPVRFVGASAGALAACCLAADLDMNEVREFTLECGEHMNSKWYHFFFMKDYVDIAIDKFATEIMSRDDESGTQEMQDRLRQTLGIYCTVLPLFKKKKFNEFSCVDDVKEALFASLCAAPMVGFPFRLRSTGELVVDGGIAAFQPKSGKSNVITVSPFYFANADIRPSQFLPMLWAFRPPGKKAHAALFDLGYNDAIDFLIRKQYIAPQSATYIRKPDPKTPRRGVFAIFRDLVFLLSTYILIRPIAIVVVYMEMIVMAGYYFMKALISNVFGKGGVTIVDWFETMANLCSPSVFMHMAVSPRIPVNERRLAKRSITFRVFAPIFGKPEVEDENDLLARKNLQRKRFAVHTPVGAPTQTQVLFDKFRNLGWSGGNSMFKDEHGRVVTNNNGNHHYHHYTSPPPPTTHSNNNNNNNNITTSMNRSQAREQMMSMVAPAALQQQKEDLVFEKQRSEENSEEERTENVVVEKKVEEPIAAVNKEDSSISETNQNNSKNDGDDHQQEEDFIDNNSSSSRSTSNTFTVEKTKATHEKRKGNFSSSSSANVTPARPVNTNNNKNGGGGGSKKKKSFNNNKKGGAFPS